MSLEASSIHTGWTLQKEYPKKGEGEEKEEEKQP